MRSRAERIYAFLLRLYPAAYKREFSEEMQFVFAETLKETDGNNSWRFWERTALDYLRSLVKEHMDDKGERLMKSAKLMNPNIAALVAVLMFVPLFVLNYLAAGDNPGFDHFFRDIFSLGSFRTNPLGSLVMLIALVLLPVGAWLALRPTLQKGADGKRRFYVLNVVLGILILAFFVLFVVGVGQDVYRCDVLLIPNCD
jgi:succinate dehydrogenase hydrophobic anchor subunit